MNIVLRELSLNDEKAFFEGLQLFSDMERSWYTSLYHEGMSYSEFFEIVENERLGINLKEGRVPATLLYAFCDGKIVGRSGIRHYLNEFLMNIGGHIGYAVATKYRQQGIATEILKQSLEYCKEKLKLDKVLVTCDDDNIGSYKVIEKNGGILEDKYISNDGQDIKRRYWIKL